MIETVKFANPEFFWLMLLLPLALLWYFVKRKKQAPTLQISTLKGFTVHSWASYLRPVLLALRLIALAAIITALARPQTEKVSSKTKTTQGVDIVMAIDVSISMLGRDLEPDRLSALKKVAAAFIKKRPNDRIGLVAYAGESYTKTPITIDTDIVLKSLEEITYGDLEDGTAIGMGLATAVNRLKESQALSKVIILLTDGMNNAGFIEPRTAADLAAEFGIKTYTIGLGTNGFASTPIARNWNGSFIYGMREVKIDETLLKEIAQVTEGQYFRATDNKKLEAIYDEIDTLEKTEIEEFTYYQYEEKFRPFILLAGLLLLLEWGLRYTVFKSFM